MIETGKNSPKSEYTFKSVGNTPLEYSDDMILTYTITLNHDLISKLKRGMYSSFFAEFDPSTGNYSGVEQGNLVFKRNNLELNLVRILKFLRFWVQKNSQLCQVEYFQWLLMWEL